MSTFVTHRDSFKITWAILATCWGSLFLAAPARALPPIKATPAKESQENMPNVIVGKVLDPEGKPLGGVNLYTRNSAYVRHGDGIDENTKGDLIWLGQSDNDGHFEVKLENGLLQTMLIAHREGYGVVKTRVNGISIEPRQPLTLRLPKEVPIRGQIVDAKGKPLEGITVTLESDFDLSLDDYLKKVRDQLEGTINNRWISLHLSEDLLSDLMKPALSDRLGKFTLYGASIERLTKIQIQGKGITPEDFYVVTRPGFGSPLFENLKSIPNGSDSRGTRGLHSSKMKLVALPDPSTHEMDLPKENPPPTLPEKENILRDALLKKSVVLKGRITDKHTGLGVRGKVEVVGLLGNQYFKANHIWPKSDVYSILEMKGETDREGRFEIRTLPGRVLIRADALPLRIADQPATLTCKSVSLDPSHRELFTPDAESPGYVITKLYDGRKSVVSSHAVKVIEVKAEGETTIELVVDRGLSTTIEILNSQGKLVRGAILGGLTEADYHLFQLPEAKTTIYSLDPKRPRTVVAYDPLSKEVGSVLLRGDEKGIVPLKLGKFATLTGRFIHPDGDPLDNAMISFYSKSRANNLYESFSRSRWVQSDKEGKFTFLHYIPGTETELTIDQYGTWWDFPIPRALKPGETFDLGEHQLK